MDEVTQTIYAFIDSQNLNLSVSKDITNATGKVLYKGWKLDYKRFFIYLRDKYKVNKSFLFIGRVAGNEILYKYLENIGYQVIYKPTLDYSLGKEKFTKGNVDAELVLHTMIQYPNYYQAMIVSGDGDYFCLIEYLEHNNKLFKIAIPNKLNFSSLLRKYHQCFFYVSDLKNKLEFKESKKRE